MPTAVILHDGQSSNGVRFPLPADHETLPQLKVPKKHREEEKTDGSSFEGPAVDEDRLASARLFAKMLRKSYPSANAEVTEYGVIHASGPFSYPVAMSICETGQKAGLHVYVRWLGGDVKPGILGGCKKDD